jgi:hypothetical protein
MLYGWLSGPTVSTTVSNNNNNNNNNNKSDLALCFEIASEAKKFKSMGLTSHANSEKTETVGKMIRGSQSVVVASRHVRPSLGVSPSLVVQTGDVTPDD